MTEQLIKLKEEMNTIRRRFLSGKKFKPFNDGVAEAKLAYDMRIILKGIVKRLSDKLKAMEVQEARLIIKGIYDEFKEAVGKKSEKKGQLTKAEQMLLAKGVLKPSDFQKIAQTITIRKAEAMSKAAGNVFRITGFPYSYKDLESRFAGIIRDKVFKITTTEITDTISEELKGALIRGYENGESIKKIADGLDMLETNYKTIARTEINGAVQEAHYTALEETSADMGVEMEKKWSTAADEKVRNNHILNEEQGWIPMDEPFQNGQMYPLDPVEDLGEFINCRCDLYYRVAEKPQEAAA